MYYFNCFVVMLPYYTHFTLQAVLQPSKEGDVLTSLRLILESMLVNILWTESNN